MNTIFKVTLVLSALLLAGCPTQQELAESLIGSWQGDKGEDGWCLTLRGHGTSAKGEGTAIYRNVYTSQAEPEYFYAEGLWFIGVGGRLQLNLNPLQLDESLSPLPPTKFKTDSFRYLVKSLEQETLVYREHTPKGEFGETFSSKRVASCDNFFKNISSADS